MQPQSNRNSQWNGALTFRAKLMEARESDYVPPRRGFDGYQRGADHHEVSTLIVSASARLRRNQVSAALSRGMSQFVNASRPATKSLSAYTVIC
ncbi:uncharacterized protein CTRU02_213695 [Colletotrichum truncatum]|uniref:Uncharacterized protein n=1 Tax=Colletotrichum truncatum TaxID=5467 RepID=A0ACC3YGF5_COLTU|nr:uncharacterized protein CTRU02_11732 [Colletotrichum truncatum]KAF6785432.1 hypothetical protein CTRU02_11732 [Colletotrichum truncatum]